ncbi:putative allantoate permease [Stachybotrys elegans]|uniref:Allantoate permease n=1 Tax=Stachybotrys elegans TaxID=80388 RepID=A0A8K0SVI4_9HYPO|nr:putative allantoate permease [Stachybotrys elegans]
MEPAMDVTMSKEEEARLVRRIDRRVLPMLFLIYIVAFLDRANVSSALTMSMPEELGLTGQQPNTALAVFFVPYILCEIPSNMLMKRFTPHVWLSFCILGFGVVMLCQGFVKNFGGLVTTRFFLGLFEAGIFPGSFYLISFWYKREEAQERFTFYFCSVIVASAFGGLLASGIAEMDGLGGLSNWRWIFILEGILTIVVAAIAFFWVSDFPAEANWLSQAEKDFVLQKTRGEESEKLDGKVTMADLAGFFKDPKNYFGALMYFSVVVPVYAFAYFTPTIVRTLGYSVVQTQLHSVPPFAAALGLCAILAYLSGRTKTRMPYVLFSAGILIIGLALLMTTRGNFSAQYAGICMVCMGAFGAGAIVICWYLMNLEGHKQRSIGSGWMISFGNTGGILAPFAFLPRYAPEYTPGYSTCMAVASLGIIVTLCYALLVMRDRRRMARGASAGKNGHTLSL